MRTSWEANNLDETQIVAKEILGSLKTNRDGATVLALSGDLGAGKTTLTQAIARELGITETLVSPTFVIAKFYETHMRDYGFEHLIHVDAYRLDEDEELSVLGFKKWLIIPHTLIVLEWPERLQDLLPDTTYTLSITIAENEKRTFSLS